MTNITRREFFVDTIYDPRADPLIRYIDSYSFNQYRRNIIIIYIVAQNRLYSEFELNLIFESVIKMVVVGIIENIFKFFSPAKQETFMQKIKNLLNNEESLITDRTI
jgi:hypothetical protein